MESTDQLKIIFRDLFELGDDVEVEGLEYRVFTPWDSVAHMALIAEIEDGFDIMLDTDEVIDMSSFSKANEIVDAQLGS